MSTLRGHETSGRATDLTGRPVLDDHHHRVGTVSDVLYDERGAARWAVVDPGVVRGEKFVPVDGSYVTDDGAVVIAYDREQVAQAPPAPRDHVLDRRTETALERHYDVSGS